MRLVVLSLSVCALLAAGCSVVKPIVSCYMQAPVMIATYPNQDCTGEPSCIEVHDGVPYMSDSGVTGKCLRCIPIHKGWTDKDEWIAARIALGVPIDLCLMSPANDVVCPPAVKRSETWGAIKALYR